MPQLMGQSLNDSIIAIRERYSRMTGKPARSLLLNEFCETTNFERKHAIKVLGGRRCKPSSNRRGAKPTCTEDDATILKSIWLTAGQPCRGDVRVMATLLGKTPPTNQGRSKETNTNNQRISDRPIVSSLSLSDTQAPHRQPFPRRPSARTCRTPQ